MTGRRDGLGRLSAASRGVRPGRGGRAGDPVAVAAAAAPSPLAAHEERLRPTHWCPGTISRARPATAAARPGYGSDDVRRRERERATAAGGVNLPKTIIIRRVGGQSSCSPEQAGARPIHACPRPLTTSPVVSGQSMTVSGGLRRGLGAVPSAEVHG